MQSPFLEAQLELINGSRKKYPSNGINFASAGSGVLSTTNQDLVRNQLIKDVLIYHIVFVL